MKTASKIIAIFTLAIIWSCSSSDDDPTSPASNGVNRDQLTGDWIVSYYLDNGKDETSDFSGYSFTFAADGIITAHSSTQDYAGTWEIGEPGDDNSNSSGKLIIVISGNNRVSNLSDDWIILSVSDQQIKLMDDSNNSVEELYFSRN